jgi:hypothetical protein
MDKPPHFTSSLSGCGTLVVQQISCGFSSLGGLRFAQYHARLHNNVMYVNHLMTLVLYGMHTMAVDCHIPAFLFCFVLSWIQSSLKVY